MLTKKIPKNTPRLFFLVTFYLAWHINKSDQYNNRITPEIKSKIASNEISHLYKLGKVIEESNFSLL